MRPPFILLLSALSCRPRDLAAPGLVLPEGLLELDEGPLGPQVSLPALGADLSIGPRGARMERPSAAWELRLARWGSAEHLRSAQVDGVLAEPCLAPTEGGGCAPGAVVRGEGWRQWWVATERGLGMGVVVERRPAGASPLVVEWEATGLRSAALRGQQALIDDAAGLWLVSQALAWDAQGRSLPASMRLVDSMIQVKVEVEGADWPVVVDPYLTAASWTLEGDEVAEQIGSELDGDGDLNGDGYDDLLVGSPHSSPGGVGTAGQVSVHLGSPSGPGASPAHTLAGTQVWEVMGSTTCYAGDVNGDGYDDVLIGSHGYSSSTVPRGGRIQLFHGSASGLASTEDWSIEGSVSNGYLGRSTGAAGDVNGDGYGDVVVGDSAWLVGTTRTGRVMIFHGGPAGLSASPDLTIIPSTIGEGFGSQVSGVGDVNGDGYDDVVATTYETYPGITTTVPARLYLGSASGLLESSPIALTLPDFWSGWQIWAAGDVNGDGVDDIAMSTWEYSRSTERHLGAVLIFHGSTTGPASAASTMLIGASPEEMFGGDLSSAGDLNRDGYDDLVIAAPNRPSGGRAYVGAVQVHLGSAAGLTSTPDQTWIGASDEVQYGWSLSGDGDLNGDSHPDLGVGLPAADTSVMAGGRVYVHLGYTDLDGDGVYSGGEDSDPDDLDDLDPSVGRPEEIWYRDVDGDGHGDPSDSFPASEDPSGSPYSTDCDDMDPFVNPDATEVCDLTGVDEDCDGLIDDEDPDVDLSTGAEYYADTDGDGYGDPLATVQACDGEAGWAPVGGDCADDDPAVYPGAEEVIEDGLDQDCDGLDATEESDTGTPAEDTADSGEEEDTSDDGVDLDDDDIDEDEEPDTETPEEASADTGAGEEKAAPGRGGGCSQAPVNGSLGLGLLALLLRRGQGRREGPVSGSAAAVR